MPAVPGDTGNGRVPAPDDGTGATAAAAADAPDTPEPDAHAVVLPLLTEPAEGVPEPITTPATDVATPGKPGKKP